MTNQTFRWQQAAYSKRLSEYHHEQKEKRAAELQKKKAFGSEKIGSWRNTCGCDTNWMQIDAMMYMIFWLWWG